MIDAGGGVEAAGGVAAEGGGVGGDDDGDGVGEILLGGLVDAVEVEEALDAAAAKWGGDVGGVEVGGGWAGVIEGVDFADVELAAGEHADAGGSFFAILLDHCKCCGGAGLELFEAPGLVEALLGLDLDEVGEEGVGRGGDEMEGDLGLEI